MHSAASVSYPVARSRRAGFCIAAVYLVGAVPVGAWMLAVPAPLHLRMAVLLWTLAAACLSAWQWWRTPSCAVVWDGSQWRTEHHGPGPDRPGLSEATVTVSVDLQGLMVLRLRAPDGRVRWLLADRAAAPERWHALRCAVTASTHSAGAGVVEVTQP